MRISTGFRRDSFAVADGDPCSGHLFVQCGLKRSISLGWPLYRSPDNDLRIVRLGSLGEMENRTWSTTAMKLVTEVRRCFPDSSFETVFAEPSTT